MLLSSIINSIFPPRCISCDGLLREVEFSNPICPACNSHINWLRSDFFNPELESVSFVSARSLAAFDGPWRDVVHNLKYNKRLDLVGPLAGLLGRNIDYEYDLITAVPLHKKRLRHRGYNQSALLARRLARRAGINFTPNLLVRWADSPQQVGLSSAERLKNVRGAFLCGRPDDVRGRDILIVDDVMTTGATVNECAKALKNSGAARVDVLTLARA